VLLRFFADRGLAQAAGRDEDFRGGLQQVAATGRYAQRCSKEERDTGLQYYGQTHPTGV